MRRKALDIAVVCLFFCFIGTGFAAGEDVKGLLPRNGIAVTVLDVPNYTYIELEEKGERVWIAAPTVRVEVGEKVLASEGIEMRDHYSKTFDRTFPVIFFVSRAEVKGKEPKEGNTDDIEKAKTVTPPAKGSIVKAKGGYTLEEIFDRKEELGGKKVVFRGMVVKASATIMGKKWFHLQDGTGTSSNSELVVTSRSNAGAGDIVVVTGILGLNKDFGQGYKYNVIIEDAEIKADVIEISKTSDAPIKGSIVKAVGGYTLEELFDKKERLEGKKVMVRGKLIKASGKIMGKRWYHLQDGTGSKEILDLVLTSDSDATAGDIVLVNGVLELGKDFGRGYKYDVIIEDAKIHIE